MTSDEAPSERNKPKAFRLPAGARTPPSPPPTLDEGRKSPDDTVFLWGILCDPGLPNIVLDRSDIGRLIRLMRGNHPQTLPFEHRVRMVNILAYNDSRLKATAKGEPKREPADKTAELQEKALRSAQALDAYLSRIEQRMKAVEKKVEEIPPKGAAADEPKRPSRRKRRKRGSYSPRKPTPLQLEALQIVGECEGDIAEAARRLGKDRKTVEQHYKAALKKAGSLASKLKPQTQRLAEDKHGQVDMYRDTRGDSREGRRYEHRAARGNR